MTFTEQIEVLELKLSLMGYMYAKSTEIHYFIDAVSHISTCVPFWAQRNVASEFETVRLFGPAQMIHIEINWFHLVSFCIYPHGFWNL